MISEHDVISDFIVVVNFISIFADVIFMNLRLLLLTYQYPFNPIFYRENHIMVKYQLNRIIIVLPIGC